MFIAVLFTIAKIWKQVFVNQRMDNGVVYKYNGHRKEGNPAICNSGDES